MLRLVTRYGIGTGIASIGWFYPSLGRKSKARAEDLPWGYGQDNGPKTWSRLSETYQACDTGATQSPIDLPTDDIAFSDVAPPEFTQQQLTAPVFDYQAMPLNILNTGRTIQVNADGNSIMRLDGDRFTLQQFHVHHPSEHRLDGDRFPLELHFVHKNDQGNLAVVAVLLKEGAPNKTLDTIWKGMPQPSSAARGTSKVIGSNKARVDPMTLLPSDRTLFRYVGSLTTPPCSEQVQWLVFRQPMELSQQQIKTFEHIFPLNARPIQPIHRRTLLGIPDRKTP